MKTTTVNLASNGLIAGESVAQACSPDAKDVRVNHYRVTPGVCATESHLRILKELQ